MSKKDIYFSLNNSESPKKVKHILAVLDLKKMIPVSEDLYSEVNINAADSDTEEIRKYKKLLEKELQFCIKIKDEIVNKATKIYIKQKEKGNVRFCVDFTAVEEFFKKK
ncbi:hypothetical protein D081_0565 [Anaerovibrio sp. JC8]|nr:hypothetical protein D081_0565 [Anaerovibrio sp. JC8]